MLAPLLIAAATLAQYAPCPNGQCSRAPQYAYAYRPAYTTPYRPAVVAVTTTTTATYLADTPAAFLAELNAYRAQYGRPPLAWDPRLAACAARNDAIHAPGSSCGASQCWAGVRSYRQALGMWLRSPAHRAILLHASYSVGCAPCPTGMTANAR